MEIILDAQVKNHPRCIETCKKSVRLKIKFISSTIYSHYTKYRRNKVSAVDISYLKNYSLLSLSANVSSMIYQLAKKMKTKNNN